MSFRPHPENINISLVLKQNPLRGPEGALFAPFREMVRILQKKCDFCDFAQNA